MKHLRIIVLAVGSLACVGTNLWLGMTGHYRAPFFVFIGFILAMSLIVPRLPRPTVSPQVTHATLVRAASSMRRLGVVSVVGLSLTTLLLAATGFKIRGMPRWGTVLALTWGWILAASYLWGAKWYRSKAEMAAQEGKQPKV